MELPNQPGLKNMNKSARTAARHEANSKAISETKTNPKNPYKELIKCLVSKTPVPNQLYVNAETVFICSP
jgi:hypothetical protein